MRTSSRSFVLALLVVLAAACTSSGGPAATVNGEDISRDELEAAMASGTPDDPQGENEPAEATAERQRRVLTLLIQDRVLRDVAEELGVDTEDVDIDAARERILESVGGEQQLEGALLASGLSMTMFDDVIVPQEAMVQAMRLELAGDEPVEMRSIRHILVDSEEEAEDVIAELDGGAEFAEVAEERSTDTVSAAEGGELGQQPRGLYDPDFEEAAWDAELDTVIGPVETQFGFHVIEATDESAVPPEEMEPQQLDQMVGSELGQRFVTGFDEAEIEVASGIGEWDAETRSVIDPERVGDGPASPPAGPGEPSAPQGDAPSDDAPAGDADAGTDSGDGGADADPAPAS